LRDLRRHAVARLQHRDLDGALKSELIGAAVALDHDAVQTDHAGAIVASGIYRVRKCASAGRAASAELAQRTAC
jgi:hypothetical protein